jgi:hypothetical protein
VGGQSRSPPGAFPAPGILRRTDPSDRRHGRERGKELVWCPLPQQRRIDQLAKLADRMIELDEKFLRSCAMPGW